MLYATRIAADGTIAAVNAGPVSADKVARLGPGHYRVKFLFAVEPARTVALVSVSDGTPAYATAEVDADGVSVRTYDGDSTAADHAVSLVAWTP